MHKLSVRKLQRRRAGSTAKFKQQLSIIGVAAVTVPLLYRLTDRLLMRHSELEMDAHTHMFTDKLQKFCADQ